MVTTDLKSRESAFWRKGSCLFFRDSFSVRHVVFFFMQCHAVNIPNLEDGILKNQDGRLHVVEILFLISSDPLALKSFYIFSSNKMFQTRRPWWRNVFTKFVFVYTKGENKNCHANFADSESNWKTLTSCWRFNLHRRAFNCPVLSFHNCLEDERSRSAEVHRE